MLNVPTHLPSRDGKNGDSTMDFMVVEDSRGEICFNKNEQIVVRSGSFSHWCIWKGSFAFFFFVQGFRCDFREEIDR